MGREQLAEIQDRKLRQIVRYAFDKVPFYHRLYEAAGIDPDIITNTKVISRLPIVTKQQARDVPLKDRTAVNSNPSACIPRTTSGATGIPVTILEEPKSAARRAAIWLRRFWAYGIRPLDKACMVIPGQHRQGILTNPSGLSGYVMKRKVLPLSLATDIHDHIRLISKWKPDVLAAPASYYRNLIRVSEETEELFSLKVAIANGEMLDGKTRKLISDNFRTENVFETYGAAEVGPIAWECPTHSGYHINAESLVVECLRDGEPVAVGEPGQLCATNLYRRVTPMIRYLVGDIVTFADQECACGRGLPLIKDKQGRALDFIVTTNGMYISHFRVMHMLEDVPGVAQYKVVQNGDRSIEVLVQPIEGNAEQVAEGLAQRCEELFGNMPLTIKVVDRIDVPGGQKFRIVESRLRE